MSLKPEGCACWSEPCLDCGVMNYGCLRVNIYCDACGGKIKNISYFGLPKFEIGSGNYTESLTYNGCSRWWR